MVCPIDTSALKESSRPIVCVQEYKALINYRYIGGNVFAVKCKSTYAIEIMRYKRRLEKPLLVNVIERAVYTNALKRTALMKGHANKTSENCT